MGTNCAPLVADLFLYCYERDFVDSLNHDNQADVIEAFSSTSRYLDDLLNIDNPYFEGMVNQIYPPELQFNKKVQAGKEQEKAQSEKDSHSKNRGGKKQTNNQVLYTMKHIVIRISSYFPNRWPLSYLNLTKTMKTHIRRQQHKKFKTQRHKTKRTTTEVSTWNDQ